MNSQILLTIAACSVSLAGGFLIGSSGNSEFVGIELESNQKPRSAQSDDMTYSSISSRSYGNAPSFDRELSADAKAQSVLFKAKAKMEGSSMMMMDLAALADVWNMTEDMNAEELRLAMEALDEGPGGSRSDVSLRMVLLSQWAERDGLAAAKYAISTQKGGMMSGMPLMGVMTSWGKADPVSAEAWYQENKSAFSGGRWTNSSIESQLIKNLAKHDLDAAFEKIDFSKTSERNTAARTMGNLVADDSMRDQVIAKVQSIEDAGLKHEMLKRMVSSLSYQNVEAAGELLASMKDAEPGKYGEYQVNYLRGMQYMDPAGALSYAATEITDEGQRNNAMQSAFGQYAINDASAAQDWLNSQVFDNKDKYYQQASNQNRRRNFDQSMEWALKIEDDDMRTDQAVDVYRRWSAEHKDGAQEWLYTLDEESQQAILEGGAAKK